MDSNLELKKIFKKFIEAFIGKGSFAILTLAFSFIISKLFGATVLGEFSYGFSIISILMIFGKLGLDQGILYYFPRNKYQFVSVSFFVNFIVSLFIIFIASFVISDSIVKTMLPLIWLLSAEQIFFAIYSVSGRFKEYYLVNGFIAIISRIVIILLFYLANKSDTINVVIAFYISIIMSLLIYLITNKKMFSKINFNSKFFKYSVPLTFATMLGVIMDRIDIIMIGNMIGKTDVGVYQIATQVATFTSIILYIYNSVFGPKISKLYYTDNIKTLKKVYIKSTRLLALLSFLIFVVILVFNQFILSLFGEVFIKGDLALLIRSLGQFINAAVGSVWLMLAMTGSTKSQMYTNLIACLMNIILNFTLIPVFGITGAAIASTISVIFTNIIGYFLLRKKIYVKVYKYF
ncbi:MATE family efflux transporter [Mangrovibacillus sp. Mu-81]|uniref:MATE family efflux transporter n=1 Tax=Mangrovibacillus sp. Mu-81 TaxID=3121478 RepID=UPI002FE4B616